MVKDHGQRKRAERQRSGSGKRDEGSEGAPTHLQRNSSTRSSRLESNLKKAVDNARDEKARELAKRRK